MLIYLIIAIELVVLYVLFWSVYVRNPKPYRLVGNPWGKYGPSEDTRDDTNAEKKILPAHNEDPQSHCTQHTNPMLPAWLVGNLGIATQSKYGSKKGTNTH